MDFSPKRVFLIGLMGSGKSHFARIWSAKSGLPFYDTDQMIEKQTGKTINEIFAMEGGETKFREKEAMVLRETEWPERCFVACGGGLPCFHSNMDYLRQIGMVIWIHPPVPVLASRLWHQKAHRPLVAAMPSIYHLEIRLAELLEQRKAFYEKANLILNEPTEDFLNLDTPYI